MLVDTSKTPLDNLLRLLNFSNGTEYTADDVVFGIPGPYSDPAYPTFNTQITCTGKGEWTGTCTLYYTRLDLEGEIMYRTYKGGDFENIPAFFTHLKTVNDVRTEDLTLDLATIPDGTEELSTTIRASADGYLYIGSCAVFFTYKDGYVPPVPNPAEYFEVSIPAGTFSDGIQAFPNTARVVGELESRIVGTVAINRAEFELKPDYTEVLPFRYPIAEMLDQQGVRLCLLGRTVRDGRGTFFFTRYQEGGEVFTTARKVRMMAGNLQIETSTAAASALRTTTTNEGTVETVSYGFGHQDLGAGVVLDDGLWATMKIARATDSSNGSVEYSLNYSMTAGQPAVIGAVPEQQAWDLLGDRVVGALEFLDEAGELLWSIAAPMYGSTSFVDQAGFYAIVDQIATIRTELIAPPA